MNKKRKELIFLTIELMLILTCIIINLNNSWADVVYFGFENYKYHTTDKGFSIYGDTDNFENIIASIDYLNITHDDYKTLNRIIYHSKITYDDLETCGQYHSGTREIIIYDCNYFDYSYYSSYIYYVHSEDFYKWALSHELGHHKQNIQGKITWGYNKESIENNADEYAHQISKLGEKF
jgi:hypothetical protein